MVILLAHMACSGLSGTVHADLVAPVLIVTNGNIFALIGQGDVVQLTSSGRDRSPRMSPVGGVVAFIRQSRQESKFSVIEEHDSPNRKHYADQIWVVDLKTMKSRLLVRDRPLGKSVAEMDLEKTTAIICDDSLRFSPDGIHLYFRVSAWVTSDALHGVNLRTGVTRFITPANSVEVVMSGAYAGDLIVQKHRYFLGGGSYDWYWLITPGGREIGPIGESDEQFTNFKERPKRKHR